MGRVVGFGAKIWRLGPSDSQIRFYPVGFCKIGLHKRAHPFFRSKNKNQKLEVRSHNKRPKTPDSFRLQCLRRFWDIDPELLHACLMCPCRAFYVVFFVSCCFRQIFWVFIFFLDIRVLVDLTFPAKKKKKNRKKLGRGTLNMCANFRIYLSKTAWTFKLLCGKVQKSRLGNVISWF